MDDNLKWIPITEYSIKYKISVSTLRRRIKKDAISYKFENGKYLLLDNPLNPQNGQPKNINIIEQSKHKMTSHHKKIKNNHFNFKDQENKMESSGSKQNVNFFEEDHNEYNRDRDRDKDRDEYKYKNNLEGQLNNDIKELLNEIKDAYRKVLREKEEYIIQLKDEIIDLKTLVRVLENENKRLSQISDQILKNGESFFKK